VARARDRGSMFVFTTLVGVAMCAAVTLALVPFLTDLVHRQRAQSAADAAALAGVTGGRAASDRLADANDGVVVAWTRDGRAVTVTVTVGDRRATARATDEP
jgi:predicted MarR family transcription regulator